MAEGTLTLTRPFIWTLCGRCFGAPFPASFKRRGTAAPTSQGPCFIRCFGTALLNATEPQVLGSLRVLQSLLLPSLQQGGWTASGNTTEDPQLAQQAAKEGANISGCPSPCYHAVGHSIVSLWLSKSYPDLSLLSLLDSATAFPIQHSIHCNGTMKSCHTLQHN